MADTGIFVGAVGWDRSEWRGDFFPDGLPEDWRLAYYAHFFSCVLVPQLAWRDASPEAVAGWERDTPRRFRFLFEVGSGASREGSPALAGILGEKFAGVIAGRLPRGIQREEIRVIWLGEVPDLRRLALTIADLRAFPGSVFLLEDERDLQRLRNAATLLELLGLSQGPLLV